MVIDNSFQLSQGKIIFEDRLICNPMTNFEQLIGALDEKSQELFFKALAAHPNLAASRLRPVLQSYYLETQPPLPLLDYLQEQGFKARNARNQLVPIHKALKEFLVQRHLDRDQDQQGSLFLESLNFSKIPLPIFGKYWNQHWKELEAKGLGLDQLHLKFQFAQFLNKHLSLVQNRKSEGLSSRKKNKEVDPLELALRSLDEFYWAQRKRLELDWAHRNAILGKALPLPSPPPLSPLLAIYTQLAGLLEEGDPATYAALRDELVGRTFDPVELYTLVLYLQNFCTSRINDQSLPEEHRSHFLDEYLFWARFREEKDILVPEAHFPHSDFKNIVVCLLYARPPQVQAAREFIDQYSELVEPTFAEEAIRFCEAKLLFTIGRYSDAFVMLWEKPFSDPYYKKDSRLLALRASYERQDAEFLEGQLATAIRDLYRAKVHAPKRLEGIRRMAQFLQRIVFLPEGRARVAAIRKLRVEIAEAETVADRVWLLGKLEELAKEKNGRSRL